MKKGLVFLMMLVFLIVVTKSLSAQMFFKVGTGFGVGTQKMLLETVRPITNPENIYASFGGNLGLFIAAGYELNQYVDLEIDLAYQNGRNVAIDNGLLGSKTYVGKSIHIGPSLVFKTAVNENITPYGKLGVYSGIPLIKILEGGNEIKYKGGLPLGFSGSLGADYNFGDSFKLFTEVYHQSMIYHPNRTKDINGNVVKFKDKLDVPTPADHMLAKQFFSFGALGINLGIKIIL